MLNRKVTRIIVAGLALFMLSINAGCSRIEKITDISQLSSKVFGVPSGTVADQLVLSKFPNAKFTYYDTILKACMAVKSGEVDAAAYDEPILKNIAAKNQGLRVLPDMITTDNYGFAVQLDNKALKTVIDQVVSELKSNGKYDEMKKRWLPENGAPAAMPDIKLTGNKGVLKFGTAAATEPFSFIDVTQKVVGFDIEIATYIAQKLDMQLEVVNMNFGDMIPQLTSGKVDVIGSCITITEARSKSVLFSEPYYIGGIAAVVSK